VRKEALANMSNHHHAQAYKKVASMLTNDATPQATALVMWQKRQRRRSGSP
jgi:hypothetical protein